MVAENHDNSVIGKRGLVQSRHDPPELVVHIRNGCVVMLPNLFRKFWRQQAKREGHVMPRNYCLDVLALAHICPRLIGHVREEGGEGGRGGCADLIQRMQGQILGRKLERNVRLSV